MGSHVLAYPMMKYLNEHYPDSELSVLVFKKNQEMLKLLDFIDKKEILTIRDTSVTSFLHDSIQVIQRLRRNRLDVVVDCELFARSSALLSFLSGKLPISRMQRDLTDSTVSRNIGVAFGYVLLGIKKARVGMGKVSPNLEVIENDLNKNKVVLAEAIQTILRREGISDAYDIMKKLTRGKDLDINILMEDPRIPDDVKGEISHLDVFRYTGRTFS